MSTQFEFINILLIIYYSVVVVGGGGETWDSVCFFVTDVCGCFSWVSISLSKTIVWRKNQTKKKKKKPKIKEL